MSTDTRDEQTVPVEIEELISEATGQTCIYDTRERAEYIELLREFLPDFTFISQTLPVGDYIVNGIIIERKTVDDLLQSVVRSYITHFEVLDRFLEKVHQTLQNNPALLSSYVDVLLLKIEVLVSRELVGTVDSVMLLNVMDRIEKYSYHFEPRVLKSSTRFAKQVRWALALRESLRENP